eukprot:TRINITY_DN472_c0_g2_i1.p1 TRINITY_DN472_c0_g2~~TRINITY_DN472_c0_g2_i1.p1  ORF type:complete len:438 (+),score=167.32 TRINITY_DN472_c0_g2_i1:382-1695(+)
MFAQNKDFKLRIRNAKQVVAICNEKQPYLLGDDMDNILILEDTTILVNLDGNIEIIEKESVLLEDETYNNINIITDINAENYCIVPGLIDTHTHPVWSGDRVNEFSLKLAGASYMEIHEKGGGIGSTVNATKESSEEELLELFKKRIKRAIRNGTTLLEAKTGYGLECDTEMKLLKVIHRAKEDQLLNEGIDINTTYLGAHSIPKGKSLEEATVDILENQIPEIISLRDQGLVSPDNIDVFLEKGVFGREETRKILQAGKDVGLMINFHGDEIHPMQSGELAEEIEARAVSHLERVSDEGIIAMSKLPTAAILLPTTAYILRLEVPPARKFIENNVPVVLGSDYNPNAHCISLPFVMNLGCVTLHLTPNEALVATTINAAYALGKEENYGSIEVGKIGDFVIVEAPHWQHLIYQLVDPPIKNVIKKGKIIFTNPFLE